MTDPSRRQRVVSERSGRVPAAPRRLDYGDRRNYYLSSVDNRRDSSLWNELIERYHYLGHQPLPGAQLQYLVQCGPDLLAALGFSAAAWKVAPRDRFIGWSPPERQRNLHLIVNNARFLILPWIEAPNLAAGR